MRTPGRARTGARQTALLLLLVLAAACGTPAEEVPGDYLAIDHPAFTVAHPPAWEQTVDREAEVEAHDATVDGPVPQGLSIQVEEGYSGQLDHVALLATAARRRDGGFTSLRETAIDVEGADRAELVESTWTRAKDGEEVAVRSVDVFALRGERLVYLTVIGEAATWDEQTAAAIVSSFGLR